MRLYAIALLRLQGIRVRRSPTSGSAVRRWRPALALASISGRVAARACPSTAVASSRRAGFSKTLLAASLKEAGVDYIHLRALGTPKAGRQAARAGRIQEMHDIFNAHLAEPEAQLALEQAADIAAARPAALLCYEQDAACCHRRILSDILSQRLGVKVVDL